MCGFIFSKNDHNLKIENLLESINHRGPDNSKIIRYKNIVCGFNRLAIVDQDDRSNQPMYDSLKEYLLLFNGEIYNYKTLKKNLENDYNVNFVTNSDTEVVLFSLIKYGEKALNNFDGIFSIIFSDLKNDKTLLARDPFGVKPLYYFRVKDRFYSSSEIKPLYKLSNSSIENRSLISNLSYGVCPSNKTVFNDIKKVMPGEYMVVSDKISHHNYYKPIYDIINYQNDQKIFELIQKTINDQIPEINFGVMLSGGVDSSLLLALTKNDKNFSGTFSVDIQHPEMTEFRWQKLANKHLGTSRKEKFVLNTKKDFSIESLINIASVYDLPVSHPNFLGSYQLMKSASENNLKVMLSGEGADEVFLGYRWFLEKGINNDDFLQYVKFSDLSKIFDLKFLETPFDTDSMRIEEVFQKIYLQKWLTRQDLSGMSNSVEVRVPFLGIKLASLINKLSFSKKTKNFTLNKYYLKKYLENYFPKNFVYRQKVGFDYPLNDWIGEKHLNYLMDHTDYFESRVLLELIKNRQGSYYLNRLVFVLFMYIAWMENI